MGAYSFIVSASTLPARPFRRYFPFITSSARVYAVGCWRATRRFPPITPDLYRESNTSDRERSTEALPFMSTRRFLMYELAPSPPTALRASFTDLDLISCRFHTA